MKKVSKKVLKSLKIIGRILLDVVFYAMIFLTILAVFSTKWVKATYGGLTVDETLFHLTVPIEGTETSILKSFYTKALYPSIWMVIPIIILLFFIFDYFRRYKSTFIDFTVFKKKISIKIHTIVLALLLFAGSFYLMWSNIDKCLTKLKIYDYLEAHKVDNPFIQDNYVETSEVELTFPKKKRNLIYIFLESFESSYFSSSYGGDEYYNLLDGMTDLTAENINFSNTDKFGGALQVAGVGWTSGGLVAQTSGVPVKIDGDTINFEYNHTSFMKGVTSLGDILKDEGYNQEFIIGSDKSFGNRDVYFEGHGNYYILDLKEAKRLGKIPEDYNVWWGYEDSKLFEYAKEETTRLSQEDEPFNLTMLTVNTHFEGGYLEESCPNIYREQYSSVIACSADQVNDFVRWVQAQDFYDDTTIIISGDHLTMSKTYYENAPESYTRTVYNLFINPAVKPIKTNNRQFSTLDMFPSTLAALGVKIDGDRLALGTNLFSDEQTLIEKYGYDEVNKGLEARSTYYNNKFIYGTLK